MYEGYELASLETNICNGLTTFLKKRMPDLQMDFRYDAFPPWFTADDARAIGKVMSEDQADFIRRAVSDRKPIYSP
jgi:hypothetical protein